MLVTGSASPVRPPSCSPDTVIILWLKVKKLHSLAVVQVVVVLSGSMEPGFHRGDILFLNMGKAPIRTGEVVVFNLEGREIAIVHRVIKVHERRNRTHIDILTKVCVKRLCAS